MFRKQEDANAEELISRETFNEIAVAEKVRDIEQVLTDLHHLGISLWYKHLQRFNTLVLNPEWISNGIYSIINWASNNDRYSVNLGNCKSIFEASSKRYTKDNHEFLFELMKYYELAYAAKDGELVIPHLLEEDRPENLPKFPFPDTLMLRFESPVKLPPNLISRLIVRYYKKVQTIKGKPQYWRYGVILKDGKSSIAQVIEDERKIEVTVKGKDKTNFLDAIRNDLNDIFSTYKGEQPIRKYLITPFGKFDRDFDKKENEIWLEEMQIIGYANDGRQYYNHNTKEDIAMEPLVKMFGLLKQLTNNQSPLINIESMGDKYDIKQSQGAIGKNAKAEGNHFQQNIYELPANYNYPALSEELQQLKAALLANASSAEHFAAVAEVAKAEEAAQNKDGNTVVNALKKGGKFAFDFARDLGVNLVTEIITKGGVIA